MKVPCIKYCLQDMKCDVADDCDKWKEYVLKSRGEREAVYMKCPKCKTNMDRKLFAKNIYYFECPKCKHTVAKPKEVKD